MNLWIVNIILLLILLALLAFEAYPRLIVKRSAKLLTQEEFSEGMRKAQVIDVREKDAFNSGHILGARNFPYYSMLKQSYQSLRKDQPIYIYDQKKRVSANAANFLRKKGYTNLYILKGGFEGWTGKIKKKSIPNK